MDLLGSEMKPGREARRAGTEERSSRAEVKDRSGQACTPINCFLDIRELSVYLHVKPSTLYAWAGQGRIPCLKIHGLVRFRRDDIERWVESFRAHGEAIPQKTTPRGPRTALGELIARAKKQAYNSRPRGNQTRSSPIGKEETDGAI
jgi:excisionase family DNA binding protein